MIVKIAKMVLDLLLSMKSILVCGQMWQYLNCLYLKKNIGHSQKNCFDKDDKNMIKMQHIPLFHDLTFYQQEFYFGLIMVIKQSKNILTIIKGEIGKLITQPHILPTRSWWE